MKLPLLRLIGRLFRRRNRQARPCDLPPHLVRDIGLEGCIDRPRLDFRPLWP